MPRWVANCPELEVISLNSSLPNDFIFIALWLGLWFYFHFLSAHVSLGTSWAYSLHSLNLMCSQSELLPLTELLMSLSLLNRLVWLIRLSDVNLNGRNIEWNPIATWLMQMRGKAHYSVTTSPHDRNTLVKFNDIFEWPNRTTRE